MGTFRHTPDDIIYINSTSFPLSFFITIDPTYVLPYGAIRAEYTQGVGYTASSASSIISTSLTYTAGDNYISNEAAYAAAYNNYLNPAPSLPDAKASKISEMINYAIGIKQGHVIVSTHEYFSDEITLNELMRHDAFFTREGMPGGYYVNTVTYTQIVMSTLADLEAIIDRIIGLYYLTDLNIDVHRAAINALTSVPAVESYNYSSGWQSVPY